MDCDSGSFWMPLPQRSNSIDLSALLLRQSSIFEPTEKEACLAASVEESFEAAFDCGYTSDGEGLVDPMAEIADTVVPQTTTTGLDDASGVWPQPQQQPQPPLLLPEPAVPVTLPLCFYPTDYTLSSPIASPLAVVPTSGKRRASRALRHASPAPSSWSEAESSGADSAFTEEHEPEALSDDEYVPSPRSRAGAGRSTTSSSSRRQTAPSAVRQFSPRMAPFNWPEDVLSLDTKELNQYIKMHALSASQVRDLKTTRRRLKNRQYARVSRDRKARLHTTDTATTDGSEHDFSAATTPVFFQ